MKILKSILVVTIFTLFITSCSKNEEETVPVVVNSATNLYAPVTTDYTVNPPSEAGNFTKFNFKTGTVVTGDDWDIAFRGTAILVNGGEKVGLSDEPERTGNAALAVETGTFASVVLVPEESNFKQDANGTYALAKGSGNGWYSYNPTTHIISAIAGRIFVIKTHDGHYAKMEIVSYYKDADTTQDSSYYTFNYLYNPNVGDKNLE